METSNPLELEELSAMDDGDVIDKALMEALLAQLGEEEWRRLSEKERQEKLLQLRLRERKLRREGNN